MSSSDSVPAIAPTPLAFDVYGSDGPGLVLIHGAAGSVVDNFPGVAALADHFTVLAPHLPGTGRTAMEANDLQPPSLAARICSTISEASRWYPHLSQPVLCGYSLGSALAIQTADLMGERVRGVIVNAAFLEPKPALLRQVDQWSKALQGDPSDLGRFLLNAVRSSRKDKDDATAWTDVECLAVGLASPQGADAHLRLLRSINVTVPLARSSYPLLVIAGSADALVTPDYADDITALRSDARRIDLDAGHDIGAEAPGPWLTAIQEFSQQCHTSHAALR